MLREHVGSNLVEERALHVPYAEAPNGCALGYPRAVVASRPEPSPLLQPAERKQDA